MKATEVDVRRVVNRLLTTYTTRKGADELVGSFMWVFEGEGVTGQELSVAAIRYAKTNGRYFPSPGQLLEIIKLDRANHGVQAGRAKQGYALWLQDKSMGRDDGTIQPCPVCGERYRWVERQLVCTHDRGAHERMGESAFPIVGPWYQGTWSGEGAEPINRELGRSFFGDDDYPERATQEGR